MPYVLRKGKTDSTPYILIDSEKGYMRFEGESFHENVTHFYQEVNQWLKSYLETDFSELIFDCELIYFNNSTANLLLNMLMEMDNRAADGKKVTVNWITTEDNDFIIECGEDFKEEMNNLTFNQVLKHSLGQSL